MLKLQFTPLVWGIIAILIYVILAAGTYFIFLSPLFLEADQTREDTLAAEEYVILKRTAGQLAQFKEQIADRNNLQETRTSLDSVAVRANIKIVEMEADTTIEQLSSGFLLRGYTLIVEGHYMQITDFVAGLEQENNYFTVSNITVERIDENTGRARTRFTLRALAAPLQEKVAVPPQQQETDENSQGLAPAQGIEAG